MRSVSKEIDQNLHNKNIIVNFEAKFIKVINLNSIDSEKSLHEFGRG
jgi:hypothetical protein